MPRSLPFSNGCDPAFEADPYFAKQVLNRHAAMDVLVEADEAAEVVVWRCSDAASFANGAILTLEGGIIVRLYRAILFDSKGGLISFLIMDRHRRCLRVTSSL